MDGRMSVKARLAAKGYRGLGLQDGIVDSSGRVSLRSSMLQVISLCAIKKWDLWCLDIKTPFLPADGATRDVFLQAPDEWGPLFSDRVWKLKAPASGLHDAPAALRRSPRDLWPIQLNP